MFNLNEKLEEKKINKLFNQGKSGKVENVRMKILFKRNESTARPNSPDFLTIFYDDNENKVETGFYYPRDEKNEREMKTLSSRMREVGLAICGPNYIFKQDDSWSIPKKMDAFFTECADYLTDKSRFNVFTSFGSKQKPKQFPELRYFNFVESFGIPLNESKLVPNDSYDLLERPVADQESTLVSKNDDDLPF